MSIIEIFLWCMIVLVFIVMIIAEIVNIVYQYKPNFLYDFYVHGILMPKLQYAEDQDEILKIMQREINDNSIKIWRQAIFISFFTSIISTFLIKIYDPSIRLNTFIILFFSIFFVTNMLLMLLDYHFYGMKMMFVNKCIQKIQNGAARASV